MAVGFLIFFAVLVWLGRDGQFLTLFAAVICTVATRASDLVILNFGAEGLKAELKRVVQEAQVTIEEFHRFAFAIGGVALDQLFAEGRYGSRTRRQKALQGDEILKVLEASGVDKERLDRLRAIEYRYNHFDYVSEIFKAISKKHTPEWNEALNEYRDAHRGIGQEAGPDELETLIKGHDRWDADVAELMSDYRHYQQTKEHRRPDVWFSLRK